MNSQRQRRGTTSSGAPGSPDSADFSILDVGRCAQEERDASAAATPTPVFGRMTKMMSQAKARAATQASRDSSNLFIHQTTRPEHHMGATRVYAPKPIVHPDRLAPTLQTYSAVDSSQPASRYTSSGVYEAYGDGDFYTDPSKASADLKALLEGGMNDEDNEANTEAQSSQKGNSGEAAVDDEKKETTQKDGTVEGLRVKLLPHQVEGVDWMKGRELGPVKKGKVPKGGILADDMGLGKTLQTISLILGHQKPKREDNAYKRHFDGVESTTLVVAPLALIRQWEAEIKEKVAKTHRINLCVHHGPNRTKRFKDLTAYDVVITTYQILVSEHGKPSDTPDGPKPGCFGIHWWRVVLDEAHTIKNRNAKATKACYALRSEYRWCLSGTPMQNNLDELQSLVKFLRISPYDNLADWKDHIEKPMKNGKGHIAIRRLHSLLRCFMKRRTKEILKEEGALNPGGKPSAPGEASSTGFKVTQREVVSITAEFSSAERKFYSRLESRADARLKQMMKDKVDYTHALVLLLRLRQACNHPKLLEHKLGKDMEFVGTESESKKPKPSQQSETFVDAMADMFAGMGIAAKTCGICGCELPPSKKTTHDNDMCDECSSDLVYFNHEAPKRKRPKHKKARSKKIVEETISLKTDNRAIGKRPRVRNIIMGSDDEDTDASWLVPEEQRGVLRLGKAGGEEDEDAENGGEWIGGEDSEHGSEDDEDDDDGSELKSFVVNDDAANSEPPGGDGYSTDGDGNDSLPPLDDLQAQVKTRRVISKVIKREDSDEYESDEESEPTDSGVDESEFKSDDDDGTVYNDSRQPILASAKIRQLLSILHREVREHKFIVFSQFTSMMDLIEPFFRKEGLKFTRYDGSMRNDEREASLNRLRNDKNTRILLCSLKCGSLGLNLTAATRVVILEPFWNPFVEEQAIDRVHRLTQKIDVVVYKITIEKTVEERILTLQESKRRLAEEAIEGGMKKNGFKLGVNELMDLFRHDAGGVMGDADAIAAEPGANLLPHLSQSIDATVNDLRASPKRRGGSAKTGGKQDGGVFGRRW